MTRAMSAVQTDSRPRVLRVGLVQGGRIVEERTLKKHESLRVGASEKNELIIESRELGASYLLVEARDGGYTLHVPAELSGRVSDGEKVRQLSGGEGELVLSGRSRGRLQISGATILFQFVPEPMNAGRAQLPVAARGGLGRGIDWLFTCFVLASYMGFFGLVVFLENADWELEPPNLVPELAARLVFNEPAPPVEQPAPALTPVDAPDVVAEAPAESPRRAEQSQRRDEGPQNATPSDATPADATRSDATPSEEIIARNEAIRDLALSAAHETLGGLQNDGRSSLVDLLRDGAPTENAGDVLARVVGVETANRRADELRDREGGRRGSGTTEGIGVIARRESEVVRTGPLEETRVRGVARARPPIADGGRGDIDMQRVASMVRRRMPAIRACYERELNPHPDLAGKVVVEFTVQENGSVTNSHAVENLTRNERLGSCLSRVMRTIRITPGPEGGSVTILYPFVFALQQ